jgi:hypothetical protein
MRKWMRILPALMAAIVLTAGSGCATTAMNGHGQPRVYEVVEPDGSVHYVLEHAGEVHELSAEEIESGGGENFALLVRALGWMFFWFVLVWLEYITETRSHYGYSCG